MVSKTAIHALKALALLASLPPGTRAGAAEIAAEIGAPPNYLGKLLRTLAASGLVESQKGKGGGFRLARDPSEIRIIEIIEPIDPVDRWSRCFLGRARCSDDDPCALHERWAVARDGDLRFLQETFLADVVGEVKR